MDGVDWAFAGTSSSSTRPGEGGEAAVRHSVWRHVVDSRTRHDPETAVVDEADMFPAERGADGAERASERGRMVNPDTGLESDYEETWRDVEPRPAGTEARARCVVLELKDDAAERRGLVVRLGRHCQGVVRCGEAFALERWAWAPDEGSAAGSGWARRTRVGALYLPCEEALKDPSLKVGDSVQRDGNVWTAVEVCDV